jgi:hypothetical protein
MHFNDKATAWHTPCFIFVVKNHQMVTLIQILDVKTSKEILSLVGGLLTRCKISQCIFQKMNTCFISFFEMPHFIFNCFFSRLWENYLFIFKFDENGQIFMSCNALGPGHYPTQKFPFLKNKLSNFGLGGGVSTGAPTGYSLNDHVQNCTQLSRNLSWETLVRYNLYTKLKEKTTTQRPSFSLRMGIPYL